MITQTYNLNLIPEYGSIPIVVHASQYDKDSRTLVFNLLNGDTVFTCPAGTTAVIEGTKPDGHGFQYEATVSGSTVTATTTQQMCAVAGTVRCELRLTSNDEELGTANFVLEVERAGLADDTVTSDSELPDVIALATEQMERAEQAADDAEAAQGKAEDAQEAAETAQGKAEDAADEAEAWSAHPPYIGANGHWYVYDINAQQFVDTGFDAVHDVGQTYTGASTTAASTATKDVTTVGGNFVLQYGATVAVDFSNANTASGVKLNVDNTGAKDVYKNGVQAGSGDIDSEPTYLFVYDGTKYIMVSGGAGGGGGAYYGTSTTAGSTAAKTATTTNGNFSLKTGADIIIKFANDDTAGSITLSIDGSTAKPVYKDGAAIEANVIKSTNPYEFVYNGTQFDLVGGAGGASGHTILNKNGQAMTARKNLQFGDSEVTDDATNDITKINVNNAIQISWADYQLLSEAEKNNGNVYYIPDYPGYGGVFYFNSKSAMDTAITNGDVPNGAVCLVGNDTPYVVHASDVVYGSSNVGTALDASAKKVDLTNINITGNSNNTGNTITNGTYFYKDGTLVRATADIAASASFTLNTNYEVVTAGALNSFSLVGKVLDVSNYFTPSTTSVTFYANNSYLFRFGKLIIMQLYFVPKSAGTVYVGSTTLTPLTGGSDVFAIASAWTNANSINKNCSLSPNGTVHIFEAIANASYGAQFIYTTS